MDQNLIDGFENATATVVHFTRLLNTGDSLDMPITNAPVWVLFAMNPNDGNFVNGAFSFQKHTITNVERSFFFFFVFIF
jgi:hypothetical protein